MAILEKATPATFGEVEKLTPWRAAHYFITEHTTLANVASIEYVDVTDDYRYPRFGTGDSNAIASIQDIFFTINAALNIAPTGEIQVDRIAWYLSTAARNALTTVANFTMADTAVMETGGQVFEIQNAAVPQIGRELSGGGVYNTTTLNVQILRATTPAVVQSEGIELATLNRQILIANSTVTVGSAEIGQRTADDTEARQPQTLLNVAMPAALAQIVYPHRSRWYTWTIAATDNNMGIAYTTADRWTCRSTSLAYNMESGDFILNAQFQLETQGTGYQSLVTTPLASGVQYFTPVTPVAPVYANFPEEPNSDQADPDNPTEQPFSSTDVAIVNTPIDPSVVAAQIGSSAGKIAMIWQSNQLWKVTNLTSAPVFTDVTPTLGSYVIEQGHFSYYSNIAWVLTSLAASSASKLFYDPSFGSQDWRTVSLQYVYKRIIPGRINQLHVYCPNTDAEDPWTHTFDFRTATGVEPDTTYGLGGWTEEVGTWAVGGVQTEDVSGGGVDRRRISLTRTIAATTLTGISYTYNLTKGTYDPTSAIAREIDINGAMVIDSASTATSSGSGLTFPWTGSQAGSTSIRMLINSSRRPTPDGFSGSALMLTATITGTGTNPFIAAGKAGTRYSSDGGITFNNFVEAGDSPAASAGADTIANSPRTVGVAVDAKICQVETSGAFSDEANGDTTGTYALVIRHYARSGANAYYFGTAAALGGGYLFHVVSGALTDITPNDGVDPGIPINSQCIYGGFHSPYPVFGLFTFGGVVKFAYNRAEGADTWLFDTTVSASANFVRVTMVDDLVLIFVCDGANILYATWDMVNATPITFRSIATPGTALEGIELFSSGGS
jgi:hypothetical protein